MIYTLTLNPSIDYILSKNKNLISQIRFNENEVMLTYGGKGINTSFMLNQLNVLNQSIFPLNKKFDLIFKKMLKENNINFYRLDSNNDIRINVKLKVISNEYEFNGPSFSLSEKAKKQLMVKVNKFKKNDYFLIMGTINSKDYSFVEKISKICFDKKVNLVYDCSPVFLKRILKYNPLFIKPNINELEKIFNIKISTKEQIIKSIKRLETLGAKNISITMGANGSINKINGKYYQVKPIKLNFISSVGAGDSFVAGFLNEYIKNKNNDIKILKTATACASATVSAKKLGTMKNLNVFYKKIKILNLK